MVADQSVDNVVYSLEQDPMKMTLPSVNHNFCSPHGITIPSKFRQYMVQLLYGLGAESHQGNEHLGPGSVPLSGL